MKVVKHLIHDAVLWTLLVMCLLNVQYSNYAENIVSFYGIFMLVVGSLCILIYSKIGESLFNQKDFKPRGKIYSTYSHLTAVIEIAAVASMGWWWVTAGFTIYSIAMTCARQEADKLYEVAHG